MDNSSSNNSNGFIEEVASPGETNAAPTAPTPSSVAPPQITHRANAAPSWLNDGIQVVPPQEPVRVAPTPPPVETLAPEAPEAPDQVEDSSDDDTSDNPVVKVELEHVPDETTDAADTDTDRIIGRILGQTFVDEEARQATTADDVVVAVPCQGTEAIGDALIQLGKDMGTDAFRESFQDPNSLPSMMRESLEHLTSNFNFLSESLTRVSERINKNTDTTKSLQDTLVRNVGNIGTTLTRGIPKELTKNKRVSGESAAIYMASMAQGLRRIPLWNSGIYITVRALSMKELVSYYSTVNGAGYDYGRELGAWFFLYADYTVKKQVLEQLLPAVLTDCNYKQWNNHKKLLNVISLHDYDVILWALASMMYREGVPVKFTCVNCNHVETIQADISKTRYVDTSKLTKEAIDFMGEPEKIRNDNDLKKYKESLELSSVFKLKIDNKATGMVTYWELDLDTASCGQYIAYGDIFNAGLFQTIHKPSESEVREYITINFYKAFLPWISEIRSVTEEGYNTKGTAADKDTIMVVDARREDNRDSVSVMLDMLQMENQEFETVITDHIRDTRVTHIAHPYFTCTSCHKQPSTSVDGFIPYDIQSHFFRFCLMRMLTTKD